MKYGILLLGMFLGTSLFTQEDINQEFIEWVEDNNLEEVKNYLNKGANINHTDDDGKNAAFYAVENEEEGIEIFHFLLSKGINVKAIDGNSQNLLHVAASNENIYLIDTLIALGVNINAQDTDGFTPIMYAAKEDNFEIVDKLAMANADLSILNEDEETVLKKIDLDDADWDKLIQYNWSQNQLDYLLFYQVNDPQNIGTIKALIEKGANVNSTYDEVPMTIVAADMIENAETITLLLSKGMNPNATDEDNKNALWYANNVSSLNAFIKSGTNINQKDSDEYSILHDAIKWGNVEYVEALIKAGANVNIDSPEGKPLAYSKTLKDLPNKRISYASEELRKEHLNSYLERIKTIQKLLKANGAK